MTFLEMVSESREMADISAWAEKRGKLIQYWWFVKLVLQGTYHVFVAQRLCDRFGHDLVDHGYANPDSGATDMHCLRCGQNWFTQLY